MPTQMHIMWLALAVMGYALVTCTLVVLAERTRQFKQRHDLLVETKRLRIEYMRYMADREQKNLRRPAAADDDEEVIEAEVIGRVPAPDSRMVRAA